jgi:polyisoprenoid-binding protein YceI
MSATDTYDLTRVVEGREVPAPGTYTIDPSHSSVEAVARHMMVSKVRGHFATFSGTIEVADTPENSRVEVTIDADSIDTRDAQRDAHLRSPDFLDVETYPSLTFRSTAVEPASSDRWKVTGDLTIRDETHAVVLDVEFLGAGTDPFGNDKIAFSASTDLDREAWGITWNAALETGGVLVGKTLKVELDIQAVVAGG